MPRSIESLHARRAAQLKALAQVRNTLPRDDHRAVAELFDVCPTGATGLDVSALTDKQLELIGTLAARYLREVQ